MTLFDYNTISDEAVRTEYKRILDQSKSISDAVYRAYGKGRKGIETVYVSEQTFNSYAKDCGPHYQIEIDSSVPLFLMILFGRLMSDERVLPYLESSGATVSDYSLPAVADPAYFGQRREWSIGLNEIRSFAAGKLADICLTFVLCHEIGHILCGHVEGLKHYEGEEKLAELISSSKASITHFERRKSWECDADAVATTLLMNRIAALASDIEKNEYSAAMFGKGKDTIPHILAIVAAALFAFFSYMQGVRHKLKLKSTHPHPMTRASYLRGMLASAAKNWWEVDHTSLEYHVETRFAEFMEVLEDVGLFDDSVFTDQYIVQIAEQVDGLTALQQKYRPSCREWCWIPWE